jgi:dolichol-phosphate mannosyltransferase
VAAVTAGARPDLTMVIPTYNERHRLAELVRSLFNATEPAGIALELVIVDDNSPDGTGAVADELARTHPIRVVHRRGKLGLGSAVVEGFAAASADVVGVMDADFSHPPAFVPTLFRAFRDTKADLAVASRYIPGGGTAGWPLKRRLLSRAGCLLARPLSPVRDAASGFFLIRRDVAQRAQIQAHGFKIGLELIMRAWPVRLTELPYQFIDREVGQSKMGMREAVGYLTQLKALYTLRFFGGRARPRRQYRRFSVAELKTLSE